MKNERLAAIKKRCEVTQGLSYFNPSVELLVLSDVPDLLAENERLRTALEIIAAHPSAGYPGICGPYGGGFADGRSDAADIAVAALREDKG